MYCKHCGKEIDDNSVFCKHCGKPQDNRNKTFISKPIWIIYLIWSIANLYLLTGKKAYTASDYFFPYGVKSNWVYETEAALRWDKDYYDFFEFLIYVFIVPAIFYITFRLLSKIIKKRSTKYLSFLK